MAHPCFENPASIDWHDEFDEANGLELDGDLLMSLLEELQAEEIDNDDKLTSIMESLEFEISHPDELNIHYSPVVFESGRAPSESQSGNSDARIDDTRDWVVPEDLDFSWVDMEVSSPSTSNELNNYWYTETYGDEMMDGMNEFGNVTDYCQVCYGAPTDQDQIYCSLWEDN